MRTIDLSPSRAFELTPRTPPPRDSFLPVSLTPSPLRKSPYFTMPRRAAARQPTPRAQGTPAAVSALFKASLTTMPKLRPKAVPNIVNEFDDIEEISEADYTEEELQRSAKRRAGRALKCLSSNAPSSSYAETSSLPTPSDALEPEHIDLVASSPPALLSPRKLPALSSSATASTMPSSTRPGSGRTRSPSPLIRRTRRRVVAGEAEEQVSGLPRQPASILTSPSKPSSSNKDRGQGSEGAEDEPVPAKQKGKGRADPNEEDCDDMSDGGRSIAPVDEESPDNYDDGWSDNMADIADLNSFNYEPIDIPDFERLPSTQAPRSRTRTPPIYVSDDESPQAQNAPLPGAAARAAALSASFSPDKRRLEGLTLISELSPELQEFYLNHFRRGANESDSDEDPDGFGVAAVVPKRTPARGRGRGRGRGSRGRGMRRGTYARRSK
ncbi:hypothetical protein CspeluHIS016_0302850 [Cutaneotrichosporon spelunceum]|uniref:Uncharacterized protein n=1 Tax=Cutaneotrichosporon spelunceum TaxID=1672016 RepID=A0AAD3TT80_9TREE|nr:hypothetical protein CspeluHIS016_0302850 [Cutaneotrichosporon spelunceum]